MSSYRDGEEICRRVGRRGSVALTLLLVLACPAAWGARDVASETNPTSDDGGDDSAAAFDSPGWSVELGSTSHSVTLFGNVDLLAEEEGNARFEAGAVDLFVTSQLSDHWSVLVEMVFETEPETNELVVDLERVRIGYDHSDRLRVELGRMHNPLVAWNFEQHHGLYLQTTVSNPRMADWEDDGGLWPVHVVGLRASGQVSSTTGLRWQVSLANGRGRTVEEIQVGGDVNESLAYFAQLGVEPPALYGLSLFASYYRDQLVHAQGDLDESIVALGAHFLRGPWEVRTEWSGIDHERRDATAAFNTSGAYGMISYQLRGRLGLRPYLMWDRMAVDENDPYFPQDSEDYEAWAVGCRWDPAAWVAIKAELQSREVGGGPRDELFRLQFAVQF